MDGILVVSKPVLIIQTTTDSSSLWFIAHPSDFEEVKRLWKTLDRDFEMENFFAPLSTLKSARSKFFLLEQKVGDFVIIPRMACHQVVNKVFLFLFCLCFSFWL